MLYDASLYAVCLDTKQSYYHPIFVRKHHALTLGVPTVLWFACSSKNNLASPPRSRRCNQLAF